MTGPLAVVDLETTGLAGDGGASILEVGIVLAEAGGASVTTLESLVRPGVPIPRAVQRLTGLTDADVAEAPGIASLAPAIAEALDGRTIVAHNAGFERHFLSHFVSPALDKARYLDTQELLSITHPDAPDLRLETFTRWMLQTEERHRALSDALDTLRVLSLAALGSNRGERRYGIARSSLESYAPDSPWLGLLDAGPPLRFQPTEVQFVAIGSSSEEPVAFDEDAIAGALADEARGRRHFRAYRVREGQIRMARAFVRNLADGGRLLLEGGTGVGKSLAYLAAAIPFCRMRAAAGIREPILISTRTKLLQDQLLMKDIPAAAAMLGHSDLRALSIKGRANYACGRRLAQVLAEGREPRIFAEDRLAYAALAACAGTRRHGEVGTLPGALLFRFPALRDLLRRSVAARADQCTREQCAAEPTCPLGRRRAALAEAQLVVANHDLLLRWPPDYPQFSIAIADEAHELPGVADEVYAREVRPEELLERVDDLFGRPADGPSGDALLARSRRRGVEAEVRAWRREVHQDLAALGRSLASNTSEYGEVQLPADAAQAFPEPAALAGRAAARLRDVADLAERLDSGDARDEDVRDAVDRAAADLRGAAAALEGAFAGENEDTVAAFERLDPPFDHWRLVVRGISPAQPFHERFVQKLDALACVSASLFVGGDSFAAMGELEIEAGSDEPVNLFSVESPFPYAENMRVVALAADGDLVEATTAVIADLARLLGGRTLGLFTSLRRMRAVGERLTEELRGEGFDLLSPRRATDDPSALVERFSRAAGGSVLLGARTFWQGLDIPGPALQAVVIEKLPFEVPTELRRRRADRIRAGGGDAFRSYTLGKMLLNLKQMVGRLIRTEEDRGIVVIVEGRPDRPYFDQLGKALPSTSWVTTAERGDLGRILAQVGLGGAGPGLSSLDFGPSQERDRD
ncbi:MAG: helicase C-terminal domain-containing protein [Myxococcota bacterium]